MVSRVKAEQRNTVDLKVLQKFFSCTQESKEAFLLPASSLHHQQQHRRGRGSGGWRRLASAGSARGCRKARVRGHGPLSGPAVWAFVFF